MSGGIHGEPLCLRCGLLSNLVSEDRSSVDPSPGPYAGDITNVDCSCHVLSEHNIVGTRRDGYTDVLIVIDGVGQSIRERLLLRRRWADFAVWHQRSFAVSVDF